MIGNTHSPNRHRLLEGLVILFTTRIGYSVLAAIAALLLAPYSGLCIRTLRFLSDAEAINAVIDEVMFLPSHILELPGGRFSTFHPKTSIRYTSRDEFLRINPDCCKIVPNNRQHIKLQHELCGAAAKSVAVKYAARYINEDGLKTHVEATAIRAVGSCGQILDLDY